MNYFVEGLQGSGKSTLVRKLSEKHRDHRPVYEGDYSPVELAWCACMSKEEYQGILEKYQTIQQEIREKSHEEGGRIVVCYTRILTDIPGFHKDLEQYEIYNNRLSPEAFRNVILERFSNWNAGRGTGNIGNIFECSLFQNIVEDMILFQNASDQEIMDFYTAIRDVLGDREYQILYLLTEDIPSNINVIRKERTDDQGTEMWFPLMLGFFNDSPFAKKHGLSGEEAMLSHFAHRQELELAICKEIFPDRYTVLPSKKCRDADV